MAIDNNNTAIGYNTCIRLTA